jgi:hypothetical protein
VDLRHRKLGHLLVHTLAVNAKADAGARPARAALALLRRGFAYGVLFQTMSASDFVIHHIFSSATVNNKADSVDSDGRFGDVRSEYYFAAAIRSQVEHLVLLVRRYSGVKRENNPSTRRALLRTLSESGLQSTNFVDSWQKHEDVAAFVPRIFLLEVGEKLEVGTAVELDTSAALRRSIDARNASDGFGLQTLLIRWRMVLDLNGVAAARHCTYRRGEVLRKHLHVGCGRHENEVQIAAHAQ